MTKSDLLELVKKQELNRLGYLSQDELFVEVASWLHLEDCNDIEKYKSKTRNELIEIYLDDFMTWKEDYSIEELVEFLEVQNA